MSENKLIVLWLSLSILLVITIIMFDKVRNEIWFFPFLFLLIFSIGYYFYDKSKNEKLIQLELSKKLLDAREAEKKKIASELHDGLQQVLHSIGFEIKKIQKTNFTPKDKLEKVSERINDTIDEIRKMSSELYPHQLVNLGLKKAVIGMANNLTYLSEVYFTTNISDEIDNLFNLESSLNVYRIIQELFNNIIKHSNATKANINMNTNNIFLFIEVEDNGKGMITNFKKVEFFRKGLGISSIQERLKLMKGKFVVNSQESIGTQFKITIPIRNIYNL